jgi:transketolase
MRDTFAKTIYELAEQDERIWLLVGDLGHHVLDDFKERFPERFVNAGVAEQNMNGLAAGLALSGKIVFSYSITTFLLFRSLEQIRNDIAYHNVNVKLIGVGGGLAYGPLGYTHHGVEDVAITRALPNMAVIAPGDPVETRLATRAVVEWQGPCYMRIGKSSKRIVHHTEPAFEIGKAVLVREGTDVTLIGTGSMLPEVVEAADLLAHQGISAQVHSMPTVKPLDEASVLEAARSTGLLCVVEEHGEIGGLSDAVARCLVEHGQACECHFLTLNVQSMLKNKVVGGQSYLNALAGLSPKAISDQVTEWLGSPRNEPALHRKREER